MICRHWLVLIIWANVIWVPQLSAQPFSSKYDFYFRVAMKRYLPLPYEIWGADLLKAQAWQESRFDPLAVSPAGAKGIAQFMPETAAIWKLEDPFDIDLAIAKSAQYLSWLKNRLGNLGLAAAGYNAGSQRVRDWLAGTGYMPLETRNYVYAITGHTIDEWAEGKVKFRGLRVRGKMPASACRQLALALAREKNGKGERKKAGLRKVSLKYNRANMLIARKKGHTTHAWRSRLPHIRRRLPPLPWGVQLAGSFSRAMAMRQLHILRKKYARLLSGKRIIIRGARLRSRGRRIFHQVRIGAKSRAQANTICNRLRKAGGQCIVLKN